jgi:heme O synthase-like polyprenyltransferase
MSLLVVVEREAVTQQVITVLPLHLVLLSLLVVPESGEMAAAAAAQHLGLRLLVWAMCLR